LICGGKLGYLDGEASNVDGNAMWNWIREMDGQIFSKSRFPCPCPSVTFLKAKFGCPMCPMG
jgi:hypothetical protein